MQGLTNGLLMQWHTEIGQLQNSVIMYLMKGRLADFYKDYGIRINTVMDKKTSLQKEYFVFEDEKVKHEGEGKESKPVMLEGKTYEEFMKKYNDLMAEQVSKPMVIHNA